MKRGVVRISFELLGKLLQLPEGAFVEEILREDFDRLTRTARVLVQGEGLPEVPECQVPPNVEIEMVHTPDGGWRSTRFVR